MTLLQGAELTVEGPFRPMSNKTGEPGVLNPRTLDCFSEDQTTLTVRGDMFFRTTGFADIFQPVDPQGYAQLMRLVIDPLSPETTLNFEYQAVVADVEYHNSQGGAKLIRTQTSDLWINSLTVVGDDITVGFGSSGDRMYVGAISCSGNNCHLQMPNILDVYTFVWLYSNIGPNCLIDLRGFETVTDGPGAPLVWIQPDGQTDWWWGTHNLLVTRLEAALNFLPTSDRLTFRDDGAARQLAVRFAANRRIDVLDELTVGDLLSSSSGVSPGVTIDVDPSTLLRVVGELTLRRSASANNHFDLAVSGTLRYSPRGDPAARVLNFGTAANPLPDRLEILQEDGFSPTDPPPIYVVAFATWQYDFPDVLIRTESGATQLIAVLGESITMRKLVTEVAGAAGLVLDFNGHSLRTADALFDSNTATFLPAGSELSMETFDTNPATLTAAGVELPEIRHRALHGLTFASDITAAAYLQTLEDVGPLFTNGNDITVSGAIALVEGSVDLDSLPGTRFTGASFIISGFPMNPSGTWFVETTVSAPVASFTTLANSDAGDSLSTGDATVQVLNEGGNINWDFDDIPGVFTGVSALGLFGLGLRLTKG